MIKMNKKTEKKRNVGNVVFNFSSFEVNEVIFWVLLLLLFSHLKLNILYFHFCYLLASFVCRSAWQSAKTLPSSEVEKLIGMTNSLLLLTRIQNAMNFSLMRIGMGKTWSSFVSYSLSRSDLKRRVSFAALHRTHILHAQCSFIGSRSHSQPEVVWCSNFQLSRESRVRGCRAVVGNGLFMYASQIIKPIQVYTIHWTQLEFKLKNFPTWKSMCMQNFNHAVVLRSVLYCAMLRVRAHCSIFECHMKNVVFFL